MNANEGTNEESTTDTAADVAVMRNGALGDLRERLLSNQARRADYVVADSAVTVEGGRVRFATGSDGNVVCVDPSAEMVGSIAQRLNVPVRFLRSLLSESAEGDTGGARQSRHLDAFDAVLSARLADTGKARLWRTWEDATGQPEAPHYGRAMLSDRYSIVDNVDCLTSALAGITASGVDVDVIGCDLSPGRMRVRFSAPQVTYLATEFLKGYVSPFEGGTGGHGFDRDSALVEAGFELSNSETGGGAVALGPYVRVLACMNGLRIKIALVRKVHTGQLLEQGSIDYSRETVEHALQLIKLQARDAVAQYLSSDFLEAAIRSLEGAAATPIAGNLQQAVERVAASQIWTDDEQASIFDAFVKGGQHTAGGILQAATYVAHNIGDPERAADIEASGIDAMNVAARLVTV